MSKGKYEYWLTREGLLKLESWARDGLTDIQIANNMGIKKSTLYNWKNKYREIKETISKGKEVVDIEVENALLKRALGYEYEEIMEEESDEGTKMKRTTKSVAPDVTAQIFWLKNRRPDKWRAMQNIDVTSGGRSVIIDDIEDEHEDETQ